MSEQAPKNQPYTLSPKATMIDRVVGWFSPEKGFAREQWREISAAYRGGVSTRLSKQWDRNPTFIGGSVVDRQGFASARSRGRNVWNNSPIGRSILKTEVDNVVADGLNLQARTEFKDFNRESEERWGKWIDDADITGMYSGAELMREGYRSSRCDGDTAIVMVDRGGESRLQLMPGDKITNPNGQFNPALKDGVEINRVGKPLAFHFENREEIGEVTWTRIGADNVIYLCHPPEPLHVRGMTCYAQSFDLLDKLDGYIDGVATAARMATIFGLIFKSANGAKQINGLPTLTGGNGDVHRAITLENGMARYVGGADDVVQVDAKQPMSQTPDFVRIMLRLIGLPFDMPLELVLKDVSQANLSSLRGGRQDYYRACRPRRNWYIRHWSRIYQWWLSREVDAGNFESEVPEKYWDHEFQARGWEFTDPVADVQAKMLEIEAGFESQQNVVTSLGRDYETINIQNSEARAARVAAGIPEVRSTMTRDPMVSGGAPVTPAIEAPATDTPVDSEVDPNIPEVDETGKPEAGVTTALTLNGAQIAAGVDVLVRLRSGEIGPDAATELLVGVGIERSAAERMVSETEGLPAMATAPSTEASPANAK